MSATAPPETTATAEVLVARARPVYTRVAVLGLLLAAAAPLTYFVAGAVAGSLDEGTFFLVTAGVALLGAALVWAFGSWSKVVGIVVSLLIAMALFWTVFGLAYPASLVDFVPGVLLPLGVALGIGGNVAALVSKRRGRLASAATGAERRIVGIVLAVAGLAVVVSGALTLAGQESLQTAGAARATLADFAFDGPYEASAGEPTTFVVHNSDPVVHTFTVKELGVNEQVLPGSDARVDFTAPPGTYTVYCIPHSSGPGADTSPDSDEMATTLVVR
ncbi:MAG: cupredoxin domain-containing protein [Actinomycetota bacterium]|nr:cupredoxin domain-containing protein [Actinomycetota bacterium]